MANFTKKTGKMSDLIFQHRQQRFRMLAALYRWAEADPARWVDLRQLCEKEGIAFSAEAYRYLIDEGLMSQYGAGYTCHLAHKGIKAIEQAYSNPHQASEWFPPLNDITPENGRK